MPIPFAFVSKVPEFLAEEKVPDLTSDVLLKKKHQQKQS